MDPGPSKRHRRPTRPEESEEDEVGSSKRRHVANRDAVTTVIDLDTPPDDRGGKRKAAENLLASQRLNAKARTNWGPPPRTYGAGQIKKIELFDFSCHSHFEMEFNNHVTIVHGANGSGKTSIIDALQICLGATGKDTSRSTKISKMIRHSCTEAIAKVTIWNTGDEHERFEFDNLGHYFTVVKRIKATSSTTHIEDQRGKVWKKGAKWVQQLTSHLDINCSSPAVVLNQENAKTLLANKGETANKAATRLAGMLTEGMHFNEMKFNLEIAMQQSQGQMTALEGKDECLAAKQKEVDGLKEQLSRLTAGETLREVARLLNMYMEWHAVHAEEASAVEPRGKLAGLRAALLNGQPAKFVSDIATLEVEKADLEEQLKRLTAHYEQATAAGQEWQKRIAAKALAVKECKRAAAALKRSHATAETELASKEEEAVGLRAELHGLSQVDQAGRQSEIALWRKKNDALQAAVHELHATITAKQQDVPISKAKLRSAGAEVEGRTAAVRAAEREVSSIRASIQEAQASQLDRTHLFGGRPAAELRKLVDRNLRSFDRPPIGPVGAYLSLKDQRWGVAVEQAAGKNYNAWLVSSNQDKERLRQMAMQQHFRNIVITTVNYDIRRHTIPPNFQPPSELTTVLDQLVCSGDFKDVLENALIDLGGVENIVICADATTGIEVLRSHAYAEHWARRRISSIFTNDHKQLQLKGSSENIFTVDARNNRLVQDAAVFIAELQQQLAAAQTHLDAALAARGEAAAELAALKREEAGLEAELRKLETAKRAKLAECTAHTAEKPDDTSAAAQAQDEELALLQGLINEQREVVAASAAQLQPLEDAEKRAFAELEEEKQLKNAAMAEFAQTGEQMTDLQKEIKRRNESIAKLRSLLDRVDTRIQQMAEAVAAKEAAVATLRAGLKDDFPDDYESGDAQAAMEKILRQGDAGSAQGLEALWPRAMEAGAGRLKDVLADGQKLVEQTRRLSTRAEAMLGALEKNADTANAEELIRRIEKAEKKLALEVGMFRVIKKQVEVLCAGVAKRAGWYADLIEDVTGRVRDRFRANMKRKGKGWSATMDLDMTGQESRLIIKVTRPEDKGHDDQAGVVDLKQLSGGERSFTMTMFVLAMGSELGSPFFVMDEYDVFLDSFSRTTSTKQLFTFAAENPTNQYILCTPQDPHPLNKAFAELKAEAARPGARFAVPEDLVSIQCMKAPRASAGIAHA